MGRSAVFLDRDDTLIACRGLATPEGGAPGDLVDPGLVRLLPGVLEGCSRLHDAGVVLVVVSNQGSVARGSAGFEQVCRVNARVRELLRGHDGRALASAFYFCPFHPMGRVAEFTMEHSWRKPGAGMFHAAAGDLGLDLGASWMIGDAERDMEAARTAGVASSRCLLVGAGVDFRGAAARIVGALA